MRSMNSTRVRWEARNTATGRIVSAPYYAAAPAKRIAQREANATNVAHEVIREGRVWERIEPNSTNV